MEQGLPTSSATTVRVGGPVGQLVGLLILLALIGLALLILIPSILIGIIVVPIALVVFWIRRTLRRAHEPGGIRDERRNVRVIDRDQ